MRVAMRQRTAHCRHIAHAHVGQPLHGARDHRRMARDLGRMLERGERRERPDSQLAGLHHQHQRGAAGDRPHVGIVWVDQRNRFLKRTRLNQIERRHGAAPGPLLAKAAVSRAINCFSISFAFALSTGCPMLPSFPVSVASIA